MAEGADRTRPTTQDQNSNDREGKEPSTDDYLQQPGEVIFPEVPEGFVEKVAKELYGFEVTEYNQLNGYDDKNYHIRVTATSSNPYVTSVSSEGYVLKVMNTLATRRPAILYAQLEMMQHLRSHGITTQLPVPSVKGENVAFYDFPSSSGEGQVKTHAVCVRTFLPGFNLGDARMSPDLCYQMGVVLASITTALEDFYHPFYDTFNHLWSLNNMPKVSEYVHVITDEKNRRLVNDVIEQFSTNVLPRRSEIRKGYIHGDLNEQNILVQRRSTSAGSDAEEEYVISGVLDFQEAALTHPLYDLSMAIIYLMLPAMGVFDPLEVGGHVLAGYTSKVTLPPLERSLLKECMAGRLVQSLVLGMYAYQQEPSNEYLINTTEKGWGLLRALWNTPRHDLEGLWDRVLRSYADGK